MGPMNTIRWLSSHVVATNVKEILLVTRKSILLQDNRDFQNKYTRQRLKILFSVCNDGERP